MVPFSERTKNSSLLPRIQTGYRIHPAYYSVDTACSISRDKEARVGCQCIQERAVFQTLVSDSNTVIIMQTTIYTLSPVNIWTLTQANGV